MFMRILCLDVGDKKIGLAVSDPFGKTAQGVTTFLRHGFRKDCEVILKYIEEYGVSKMLIGLPLDLESEEGVQAKKVRFFAEGLEKFLAERKRPMEIQLWDESFSSKEAEEFLIGASVSRKKRKKAIDQLSAVFILQSYLESL